MSITYDYFLLMVNNIVFINNDYVGRIEKNIQRL